MQNTLNEDIIINKQEHNNNNYNINKENSQIINKNLQKSLFPMSYFGDANKTLRKIGFITGKGIGKNISKFEE